MSEVTDKKVKPTLHCSFCGKSQHEVKKLIAGPKVFICDECIVLCGEIIHEEDKEKEIRKWARDKGMILIDEALLEKTGINYKGKGDSLSKFNKFFRG